ncbi:spore germination protein [Fictibacillus enclensis]|uniref:Spore gernimation protein n=1 Tax=Fictibacillus enclensis TaxID=1017270 RepID=A0A0V8J9H3_9BACL|nr:glycosyl hydrolase family 18 protein [Fictibacillus enclensis]KSU83480.1 spore gernimation protein [Fictibacillus enclensis]SCC16153.1 spore germination protein [Fictibacillus enclensis]
MLRTIFALLFTFSLVLSGCGNVKGQQEGTADAGKNGSEHPRLQQVKYNGSKQKEVTPSQTKHKKTKITSIGFLEPVDPQAAVKEVKDVGRHLSYVAFFSYRVKPDGTLIGIKDDQGLAAARKQGAVPMLVLTNFTEGNFSPEVAHTIFTDKTVSNRLINNVIKTMKAKGYKALNIDFEHIRAKDRDLYNGFLETILPKVKKEGFITSTALAPKTSDEQSGPWHGAHDYKRHGELADFVILMTYEWGWSGGPPMAVSPVPQVRNVIDYAVSVIPRKKIVMGAPLYGYDWILPYKKGNPFAKRIAPQEATELAIKEGAEIKYDNKSHSPYFNYSDDHGKKHVVWFENEESAQAKFNQVKYYNLRGIAYWVLGEPFPQNWSMLEDQFNVRKAK